jgi:spermidine synthase
VLIGGLGFGFTLRAALKAAPAGVTVMLAEILGAVIAWNRNPAFPLAADCLADPRVTVLEQDAGQVIRQARASFDSIILDVDNGPAALSTAGNARLYDSAGLHHARAALRPGGCLAVWSVAPDPAFERLMTLTGFAAEVHRSRSHVGSGRWHTLFLGRLPGRGSVSARPSKPKLSEPRP